MKKLVSAVLTLLLCLGLALPAFAAGSGYRGHWEYEIVIEPQYEFAGLFADNGLAVVSRDGDWGYIDKSGSTVIPLQYAFACSFSEGRALVLPRWYDESGAECFYNPDDPSQIYGIIDEKGELFPVRPYIMAAIWASPDDDYDASLQGGRYRCHNGYFVLPAFSGDYVFSADGDPVLPVTTYEGTTQDTAEWDGYIGYMVPGEDNSRSLAAAGPVSEGLIPVSEVTDMFGSLYRTGWVDEELNWVMSYDMPEEEGSPYISGTGAFCRGIAPVWEAVYDEEARTYRHLLGFMDREFNWIIPPQFDRRVCIDWCTQDCFGEEGIAIVVKGDAYGAIDTAGNTVIPFEYEELLPPAEGLIPFRQDGKWGYLDAETGSEVIPARYEYAGRFNLGLAPVLDGDKVRVIDGSGSEAPGLSGLDLSFYIHRKTFNGSFRADLLEEYAVIKEDGLYGYARLTYVEDAPSSWAEKEVSAALEEGLVPAELQWNYQGAVSRGQVAQMFINLIERASGTGIDEFLAAKGASIDPDAFTDTEDRAVLAANALGIINGVGGGRFDPDGTLTRAQIAAIINRTARVMGVETEGYAHGFTDVAGHWSDGELGWPVHAGIINGVGSGRFDPNGTLTTEQAILITYRALGALRQTA